LIRHEEKETDVSKALKIFELLSNNKCDIMVNGKIKKRLYQKRLFSAYL
jgi:hypothetical protein